MIEMLGVLAIIGVLSVGGIAGYSKAMEKFKINKTIEQIAQITANVKTLYAQQTTFAGLNNSSAISMGIIPSELGTNGNDLINAFGGNIYVQNNQYVIHDGTFSIEFRQLTKASCVALATADWGTISASGVVGIIFGHLAEPDTYVNALTKTCVGEGAVGPETYMACSGSLPLSPAIASSFCKDPSSVDNPREYGFAIKYTK